MGLASVVERDLRSRMPVDQDAGSYAAHIASYHDRLSRSIPSRLPRRPQQLGEAPRFFGSRVIVRCRERQNFIRCGVRRNDASAQIVKNALTQSVADRNRRYQFQANKNGSTNRSEPLRSLHQDSIPIYRTDYEPAIASGTSRTRTRTPTLAFVHRSKCFRQRLVRRRGESGTSFIA